MARNGNICRLTLDVSETGFAKLGIERIAQPPTDDFAGTDMKLRGLPGAQVTKGANGVFRIVHDVREPLAREGVYFSGASFGDLLFDSKSGVMTMIPQRMPAGSDSATGAKFTYGRFLRFPIKVVCDVVQFGDEGFTIKIEDPTRRLGLLQCKLWLKSGDCEQPFSCVAQWFEFDDNMKPKKWTDLFEDQAVRLVQPYEKEFVLPIAVTPITDRMLVGLGRIGGKTPSIISRIEVDGRLVPMAGLSAKGSGDTVFVERVLPNTPAKQAGFQDGDVILTINGRPVKRPLEFTEALSRLEVGDAAVFTIQRKTETRELQLVLE